MAKKETQAQTPPDIAMRAQAVSSGSCFGARTDNEFQVITDRILECGPKDECKFVFFVGPKLVGKSTLAMKLHGSLPISVAHSLPFNAWAYRAQHEWLATCEHFNKDTQTLLVPFTGREHMIGFIDAVINSFGPDYLAWQYSQDLKDVWMSRGPDFIINDSVRRPWELDYIEKLANKGYDVTVVNVWRKGNEADASHETEVDYREHIWPTNVKVINVQNDKSVELAVAFIRDELKV